MYKKFVVKCDPRIVELLPKVLKSQVGIVEKPKNSNRGTEVEQYLKAAHLAPGNPYCASLIVWGYNECIRALNLNRDVYMPFPSQGNANKFFDYAKSFKKEVSPCPKVGDLIVWQNPFKLWSGHIGCIVAINVPTEKMPSGDPNCILTVEGNTSSDDKGNQRDGGGVYLKKRYLNRPLSSILVIRGLIGYEV
jgi:hypothetical protein